MSWKDKFPKESIYFQSENGILYNEDCIKIMKQMSENSVDTIITDPPYQLGFMNKDWDKNNITFRIDLWQEVLRIAKPGAILLAFGGTRTWHRLAVAIEDAGWEIKDTLMWLYGQGFPKSLNIGKAVDKKLGNKRVKIGYQKRGNSVNTDFMSGGNDIIKGFTEWEGYGTALKPAYEPIIMAMKPLDGTYVENALKWGVAGLNIDGARIPFENTPNPATNPKYRKEAGYKLPARGQKSKGAVNFVSSNNETNIKGRFPANLLLDEESAKMLDEQVSQTSKGWGKSTDGIVKGKGSIFKIGGVNAGRYDMVGLPASRFFYVAKASRKERDMGLENLPDKVGGGMKGTEDRTLLTGSGNMRNNIMKNNHPTVKPLKLMEYLCLLTKTPSGGIVLDPFLGSGTTAVACEKTGRRWVGIEISEEYCQIAKARIEKEIQQLKFDNLF